MGIEIDRPKSDNNETDGKELSSWTSSESKIWPFMLAWQKLGREDRLMLHDWVIKVDTGTVFFADRLRGLLKSYTQNGGRTAFFTNCRHGGVNEMRDSIEVISKKAIDVFLHSGDHCESALGEPDWSEEKAFSKCMEVLHVEQLYDQKLLADKKCYFPTCWDKSMAAFHDQFNDIAS